MATDGELNSPSWSARVPAASETHLRLASEAAGIGVWSWDVVSDALTWSDRMFDLVGLPRTVEVSMSSLLAMIHPDDVTELRRLTQAVVDGSVDAGSYQFRVQKPDGETVWISGRGRAVVDPSGARIVHGIAFDVTDEKLADQREREVRLEAEMAAKRLVFLDEASHVLAGSLEYHETLAQVAKLAVPELADWCAVDLLDESGRLQRVVVEHQDPEKVKVAHRLQDEYPTDPSSDSGAYRVVRTGKPVVFSNITDELLMAGAQDETHLALLREIGFRSVLEVPLISRGITMGVLILVQAESGRQHDEQDLTLAMQLAERAALAVDNARLYRESQLSNDELEERVRQRTRELEELNRELEAFTYSASHDLRAPLRGIDGFSQVLLDEYGDALDERARDYLERVRGGAARMSQIIEALLGLSRVARAELRDESVDLASAVRRAVAALREAEPDRQVSVDIRGNLRVRGDPHLLRTAMENLVSNAWKFTRTRQQATIEVGRVDVEGENRLFVKDNGAGFEMQYAAKLFAPFQKLHSPSEYEGAGVGLATVQRIIQRHHGRVWAEAQEGEGATFWIALPAVRK